MDLDRKKRSFAFIVPCIAIVLIISPYWISAAAPPDAGDLTPYNIATAPGAAQSFTGTYSDPDGWQDLSDASLYIAGTGSNQGWAHYSPATNSFTLLGSSGSCAPGEAAILSSSYFTLSCNASNISGSGTSLTVTFSLTPQPSSSIDQYRLFTAATDQSGLSNGKFVGTWTVTHSPSADSLTPSNVTTAPGAAQSLSATYSDPDGWQDLSDATLYISGSTHVEWLHYSPVTNRFTLMGVSGSCAPGQGTTLSTSFLTLNCNASSVSGSGNTLTVTFNLTPLPSFSGSQYSLFIGAFDQAGASNGKLGGSWTSVSLALQMVATGLSLPVFLTAPPGDNNRLFIVEQTGRIRIIKNGILLGTPFLNISSLVSNGFEQGLLGLAFDPNYATNGRFYISYTDVAGDSKIVRYLVSGNADMAQSSADRVLLTVDQPYENHNGGDIVFGPDGYLYIGFGDGGSGNDPQGHGQNLTDLLGSLLRIDVRPQGDYTIPNDNPFFSNPSARAELWDYGLRNPWRYSFDRLTGDLYIADVGQNDREEVNVSPAAQGSGKGLNYGWNIMEGKICTPGVNPNCSMVGLTLPVLDYDHGNGCSITGGHVYRGSAIPAIRGVYFYADYCGGWVRSFVYQNGQAVNQTGWASLSPGGNITSFGENSQGDLYILTSQGGVYRIISNP